MTRTSVVTMLAVLLVASRGAKEDVTPRATDLLRAKKLAEKNEERLQLPAPALPGWLQGGNGWEDDRGGSKRAPRRARSR